MNLTRTIRAILLLTSLVVACHDSRADDVSQPNAADLVREVRKGESWIDGVDSLHLKLDRRWHRTPEGIDARKAELRKKFPGTQPTTKQFPDLVAGSGDTIEIAFDKSRLYLCEQGGSSEIVNQRIWDGKQAYIHEKYVSGQEDFALDSAPEKFIGRFFLSDMMWPRAGTHQFWWVPQNARESEEFAGRPEDFHITGRENFRGADCWRLECDSYLRTWHVGVADHRLYGSNEDVLRKGVNPQVEELYIQIAKDLGKDVHNAKEYDAWYRTLAEDQKRAADAKYWKGVKPLSRHYFDQFLANYREVAPGCWLPMTQAYTQRSDDGNTIYGETELKVTEATVNQPLPDAMFHMEFVEGVEVNDWGHQPPLFYKYKKHFEPDEWQAILDKANESAKANNAYEHAGDALVGKPAPRFPDGTWLNSKPMKLADLKGKVVILDFFAEWCAPCRNDLPTLAELNKNAKDNGLTIIGIHTPGSEQKNIDKLIKQFELNYPIFIDVPEKAASSFGQLMNAYRIQGIPQTFVIDQNGVVAGHGTLGQSLVKARELTSRTGK